MNHQPFETWLFSEEPLPIEEERNLQEHLAICEQCQELSSAWSDIEKLIAESPPAEPVPGFANRWQARLDADRKVETLMRQRWQSWILLILILNVVAFTFIFLSIQLSASVSSPTDLLLSLIYRATSSIAMLNALQDIGYAIWRVLTSIVTPSVWILITSGSLLGAAAWIISMRKLISIPRRVK
jgi:predicted anti-sigma-YlaC factor YlaD